MRIKGLIDEDFVNYKKSNLFISTCFCDWKCCKDAGTSIDMCQNSPLNTSLIINVTDEILIERYLKNDITSAIVFGGLEPMKQFDEILHFINLLRNSYKCDDDVIIYTGYNKNEVLFEIGQLKGFKNIIIKFGRFIPNSKSRFDQILGVTLASNNQYAEKIS